MQKDDLMVPYTEIKEKIKNAFKKRNIHVVRGKTTMPMFCTWCFTVHQFTNVHTVHGLNTVG